LIRNVLIQGLQSPYSRKYDHFEDKLNAEIILSGSNSA